MRASILIETWAGLMLAVCVSACAASNPSHVDEPSPWEPKPKPAATSTAPAASETATKTKASPERTAQDSGSNSAGSTAAPAATAKAETNSAQPPVQKTAQDAKDPAAKDTGAKEAGAGAAPSTTTKDPVRAEEPIVARVAGEPVYVSELLEQVMYTDTLAILQHLDRVVMGRLVTAEAKRLRVRIDPELDAHAFEDGVKAFEKQYSKQFPNMTFDRFVDRVLGLDPIKYREHLRDDTRETLLAERVARAWLLQQEHVDMHVIVVNSEDDVKAAQKDLADGMAFEEVARKRSMDPSKEKGGLVVPMVHKDTPLGKLAFETPVGKVGGPLTDAGAWMLVHVDGVHPAMEGDWTRIGAAVEADLKLREIDGLEIRQWRTAMLDRYEVEIRPFLDLVHESGR